MIKIKENKIYTIEGNSLKILIFKILEETENTIKATAALFHKQYNIYYGTEEFIIQKHISNLWQEIE